MRKPLFCFERLSNIKVMLLSGIVFLFGLSDLKAQPNTNNCLVSSYDISTGNDKVWPAKQIIYSQRDPLWQISDRSPVFGGTTGLPMQAITAYLSNWGTQTGLWLSDSSNHAAPGIYANAGTYLTFKRSFKICGTGVVNFNLEILNDNYIQSISVDGVPLTGAAYNQTATTTAANYMNKWTVPAFSKTLSTGVHTLEIKVAEISSPNPNPIGLSLVGTISSPSSIIVNDYNSPCLDYNCVTSVEGLEESSLRNTLAQNNPNPFGTATSIAYNIVNMQQDAFVAIYDITGKELYRQAITEKGKGSISISGDKLAPGMYTYSLIVDGETTATKRMVVTK